MTDIAGSKAAGRRRRKKNTEECPYGFSLTALGHRLQRRQPTQTCSYTYTYGFGESFKSWLPK